MKILDLIQNTFSGFNFQGSAGQLHLHPWEGNGTTRSGNQIQAHEEQKDDYK